MRILRKLLIKTTTIQFVANVMPPEFNAQHNVHSINASNALEIAQKCLKSGDVVALPTDTVYGLACDANNEKAVQKLYEIKGRDFRKPIAIYVKNLNDFRNYGKADHLNEDLLERLLPGPLTLIVERSKRLNNRFLNPTTNLIGIRNADFEFLQRLSSICDGQPLALTSANRSNQPSSLNVYEFSELWPKLGGVFDAGQIGLTEEQRSASTVIDLSTPGYYKIVREGIALKQTLDVLHKFNLQSLEKSLT